MRENIRIKPRSQRMFFAEDTKQWLIDAGYENCVDEIFVAAGPGFARDSIQWLSDTIHEIRDCTYERCDIYNTIYALLDGITNNPDYFDRKKVVRVFHTLGIKPPHADCDSMFFRILAGAKIAACDHYVKRRIAI